MSKPASRATTTAAAGQDAATTTSSTSALDQAVNQAASLAASQAGSLTGIEGFGTDQDDERTEGRSASLLSPRASAPQVAFYEVVDCPVLHDHELYEPGDQLELTEREARSLGRIVRLVRD